MLKRIFDIVFSFFGLAVLSPILLIAMFLIWNEDKNSPFFIANRVGRRGKIFKMIKLRSMIINAHKTGVDSTSANDVRITTIGKFIRKFKLDELSQLWNVLLGDMSFVGPRPNVKNETDLYTEIEKGLLSIKPGITDFSSIVFADESEILKDYDDPDLAYNQLIRPGKSKLGLFYVKKRNLLIDIFLILATLIGFLSRKLSLNFLTYLLYILGAPKELVILASRKENLKPSPPPGTNKIVKTRNI